MFGKPTDDLDVSEQVLLLLVRTLEALSDKIDIVRASGKSSSPFFFPEGVGGISVRLTLGGSSASIAIGSASAEEGNGETFRPPPPPPHEHAHPMDVYPDWAATPGSTYTVAAFENNVQIGTPQPITPGKQKRVNLD